MEDREFIFADGYEHIVPCFYSTPTVPEKPNVTLLICDPYKNGHALPPRQLPLLLQRTWRRVSFYALAVLPLTKCSTSNTRPTIKATWMKAVVT